MYLLLSSFTVDLHDEHNNKSSFSKSPHNFFFTKLNLLLCRFLHILEVAAIVLLTSRLQYIDQRVLQVGWLLYSIIVIHTAAGKYDYL